MGSIPSESPLSDTTLVNTPILEHIPMLNPEPIVSTTVDPSVYEKAVEVYKDTMMKLHPRYRMWGYSEQGNPISPHFALTSDNPENAMFYLSPNVGIIFDLDSKSFYAFNTFE